MAFTDKSIKSSDITPESVFINRRKFMQGGLAIAAYTACPSVFAQGLMFTPVDKKASSGFYTKETLTPETDATSYCNFYEFGSHKSDPVKHAHRLTTSPWDIVVEGHCANPGTYALEDILAKHPLEERIYRMRCVEAWSMVVPWVGFPLAALLQQFAPTSQAKYVAFETVERPKEMIGQRFASGIDWPYVEGLRIDEAMNPLAFMATGMYGKSIPNQNGAPIRLVVPWKYGFKSIKSIVKITFTEYEPPTTWNRLAPKEYGFYSNVNPAVSHPRWSQANERRLPSTLFKPNRIPTQMFNGYGEQVAHLYKGMDLTTYY